MYFKWQNFKLTVQGAIVIYLLNADAACALCARES